MAFPLHLRVMRLDDGDRVLSKDDFYHPVPKPLIDAFNEAAPITFDKSNRAGHIMGVKAVFYASRMSVSKKKYPSEHAYQEAHKAAMRNPHATGRRRKPLPGDPW